MWELVSNYLGAFITFLSGVFFVKYILKEKIRVNFWIAILLVILISFLMEMLYVLNVDIVRSIIGYFLYAILFRIVFRLDIDKSLVSAFVFYVLLFISEIFVFLIFTYAFNSSVEYIRTIVADKIWSNTLVCVILMSISYPFSGWIRKLANVKVRFNILIYWFLSFACIIVFFFLVFSTDIFNLGTFIALCIISAMLIVVFNLFIQTYRNEQLTIKYDKMLEFIKKYEVEIENQRTFRHETKNQLLTIKSKIIDNDEKNDIIAYIDEIIKDNNVIINHSEYAKLGYLPSNGIKGLFYFKVSEAIENGIDVDINISKGIDKSFIKKLNSGTFNQLGKILGIFLDNAIEGTANCKNKNMGIEVYLKNDDVCFIISNTYSGGNIFKGANRGHGLLLAKSIIDKNNRFENFTEVTDKLYIQKLIIKK